MDHLFLKGVKGMRSSVCTRCGRMVVLPGLFRRRFRFPAHECTSDGMECQYTGVNPIAKIVGSKVERLLTQIPHLPMPSRRTVREMAAEVLRSRPVLELGIPKPKNKEGGGTDKGNGTEG